MSELIAAADDEGVEGVARIQLRRTVPIEARLRRRAGGCGSQAAVVPDRSGGRVVFLCDEFHVVEAKVQIVDGFLNEVGILIAGVAELHRGNANKKNAPTGVAITRRLEPGVVGVAVDFLFQRIEDARPGVRGDSCAWD